MRFTRPLISIVVLASVHAGAVAAQGTRSTAGVTATGGVADLTIQVPVQLQGLDPNVTQAAVFCQAFSPLHPTARGQVNVNVAGGAYSGSANVQLTLTGTQPGDQWNYDCKLSLFNPKAPPASQWTIPGGAAWAQPKTGTTPVMDVTGTVTVQ